MKDFDTWDCFKKLRATGLPETQAEAYTQVLWSVVKGAFEVQACAKKLKESGYTDQQAEVITETLRTVLEHNQSLQETL